MPANGRGSDSMKLPYLNVSGCDFWSRDLSGLRLGGRDFPGCDLSEPRPSGTTGGQLRQTARHRSSRSHIFQEIGQCHQLFKSFIFQVEFFKS